MASAWDSLLRSLQCKSQAFSDVCRPAPLKPLKISHVTNSGCSKNVRNLKDVVLVNDPVITHHLHHHHHHDDQHHRYHDDSVSDTSFGSKTKKKKTKKAKKNRGEGGEDQGEGGVSANGGYQKHARMRVLPGTRGPVLTELPEGHSSRNIVEIIFRTGWPSAGGGGGECAIERAFKVANSPETVATFEEYRDRVRSRAGGNARCVADGNEVLQFYSARLACGLVRGRTCGGGCAACVVLERGFMGAAIRTAPSSGRAHQMRARWTVGRRAMLVCRVIAGRSTEEERPKAAVLERKGRSLQPSPPVAADGGAVFGIPVGYDSVAGDSGELVVFDPRALLPCFLIVYRTMPRA